MKKQNRRKSKKPSVAGERIGVKLRAKHSFKLDPGVFWPMELKH